MKSTILLPKNHLSWSQIDLWNKNPKEYIERYFYGKESFINSAMVFGKNFATALENGYEGDDELMRLSMLALPRYEVSEYRLEATMETESGDIHLLGFLDTSFDPPCEGYREYKTGKVPWTQKRADKHGQITLYNLMIWLKHKKMPKPTYLDWIETESVNGELELTGRIISIKTERAMGDLIEMMNTIKRTAAQISAAYRNHLDNLV